MNMYWFVLLLKKENKCHSFFKKFTGTLWNARLLLTRGNGCLAQPHRGLKATDHIFKNKNHCVFQINCISLPHQPLRWAAQIDQFKCDLTSFPSIRSESVAKKQGKEVWGGGGVLTCVEYVWLFQNLATPPFISWDMIKGLSRIPKQKNRRMESRGSRRDGKEAESTNFGFGSQLSTWFSWVTLPEPLNFSEVSISSSVKQRSNLIVTIKQMRQCM